MPTGAEIDMDLLRAQITALAGVVDKMAQSVDRLIKVTDRQPRLARINSVLILLLCVGCIAMAWWASARISAMQEIIQRNSVLIDKLVSP